MSLMVRFPYWYVRSHSLPLALSIPEIVLQVCLSVCVSAGMSVCVCRLKAGSKNHILWLPHLTLCCSTARLLFAYSV